jgi:hypothetical protein
MRNAIDKVRIPVSAPQMVSCNAQLAARIIANSSSGPTGSVPITEPTNPGEICLHAVTQM